MKEKPISNEKCNHPECKEPRAFAGWSRTGKAFWRKKCFAHYAVELANKKGFDSVSDYKNYTTLKTAKNKGFDTIADYKNDLMLKTAKSKGFDTIADYKNSTHPYRKFRKTYCENVDGRLGFVCTTTILLLAQLHVDHIDGLPNNEVEENYQTLCGCCHTYKTIINKDYKSPGRKTLGITY